MSILDLEGTEYNWVTDRYNGIPDDVHYRLREIVREINGGRILSSFMDSCITIEIPDNGINLVTQITSKLGLRLKSIRPRNPVVEGLSAAQVVSRGNLDTQQQAEFSSKLKACFTNEDAARYNPNNIPWLDIKNAVEAADKWYGLFQMDQHGHQVGVSRVKKTEKNGFRFDSYSGESPEKIRKIGYYEAFMIARNWGVPLMPKEVFEELRAAGIIINKYTWDHLESPPDLWFRGNGTGVEETPRRYSEVSFSDGGFRCSVWLPEV